MKIVNHLHPYRFSIFLVSLLFILFGTLFVPFEWFHGYLNPIFFIVNILAGVLLISKKKSSQYAYLGILFLIILLFIQSAIEVKEEGMYTYIEFAILFSFYCMVTIEIIHQVLLTNSVNRSVILGLMCGYISLGLIGFFIFMTIEMIEPGSFSGLSTEELVRSNKREDLTYFSFITLLTIGYGDIVPLTNLSRKATILIGLLGQFYLVIVTAVVIEKYIRNNTRKG